MKVDFYHLAASPLETVLPRIAERVLAEGGRLLVVSGDERQRESLDASLWTYARDSFLPHARAGEGNDALQPVLIAGDVQPANAARNVALVDGAWREEALRFGRAFHFFDDNAIAEARQAWRTLAGREDVERRFWKQNEAGKWEQAA